LSSGNFCPSRVIHNYPQPHFQTFQKILALSYYNNLIKSCQPALPENFYLF